MSLRPLPPKLQEKAEKELNEDTSRLEEDLQHIEEWLEKQPHLKNRKDRQFLVSFLRCSKFSLQRTKEKLDFFYTMKTLAPEYFMNKDPYHREIQDILNNAGIFPITVTAMQAGLPTILLLRWEPFDPQSVHFINMFKSALMSMDYLLNEDDNFTINGVYLLHDFKGFSFGYVKHLTPALCKKAALSLQAAYPLRLKGILCINTPTIFDIFVNMFLPFLNEKIKSRLKIFREDAMDNFYELIPNEVLPEEYGGKAESIFKLSREYKEKLENYRDWFLQDEQYVSDESKRPGKPKTSADVFGVEGSFRKLNID